MSLSITLGWPARRTGHAHHARSGARRPQRYRLAVAVTTLAALVLAAGAAVVVGYLLWPRWPTAAETPAVPSLPVTIGGVGFNLPPAAIRQAIQRRPGAQDRVDLAFVWPGLAPPAPVVKAAPGLHAKVAEQIDFKPTDQVFVTIAAHTDGVGPAERLRTIYPRYTAGAGEAPDGLAALRFRDATPYQNEDVFYVADRPERFLARCTRPTAAVPGSCLMELPLGGADVRVRFPRDLIGQWRDLADGIARLMAGLRAG